MRRPVPILVLLDRMQHIDWTRDVLPKLPEKIQTDDAVLRVAAEVLIKELCKDESFEESLTRIINADARTKSLTSGIPDDRWNTTVHVFNLEESGSIYHIRNLRQQLNMTMPAHPTPKNNNDRLVLKFAFDGGRMTSRSKRMEEIGTVDFIYPDTPLADIRSHANSHQWIIFFGEESRELLTNRQQGVSLPVLTCDMAALTQILGLYNVFHPSAMWKCPWCHCSAASGIQGKARARLHYGIIGRPIFDVEFSRVIPCNLHCVMAITRKLLVSAGHEVLEKEMEQVLKTACSIKLPPEVSKGGIKKAFMERVKRARFGRPQHLAILEHHTQLIDLHHLASLAAQAKVAINEQEWFAEAQKFGEAFVDCFWAEAVTPYIHVFIYHFGFFLETFSHGSNGLRHGEGNAAQQQLSYSYRCEVHESRGVLTPPNSGGLSQPRKRKREPWAERNLSAVPAELKKHVISSNTI